MSEKEKAKLAEKTLKDVSKTILDNKNQIKVAAYVDKVKLGVDGWKMRYYTEKFTVSDPADVPDFVARIKQAYIEGLQWVLMYYYKGCMSWDWYFPYHYAPFSSDLIACEQVEVKFEMG